MEPIVRYKVVSRLGSSLVQESEEAAVEHAKKMLLYSEWSRVDRTTIETIHEFQKETA